jgi:hypothetical protein
MSYAERKNTLTKKQLASMSKWATQRPSAAEEAAKVSQQRRDLWTALNAFITERGGAIVTPMFVSPVRIEVPPDSELPAKLAEAGYDLTFCEQATRIGAPIAKPVLWGQRSRRNDAYAFRAVNVYELKLPK